MESIQPKVAEVHSRTILEKNANLLLQYLKRENKDPRYYYYLFSSKDELVCCSSRELL